ncbi:MAG: response regulator transcription factor [Pseudomonadota bacterium]
MQRVLVLEDDAELRLEICEALEVEGFAVHGFGTVQSFMTQFARSEPDLVLMDLGLPDGRGSDVIRKLREKSSVGILVLSGRREEADRIIALEYGADDFVVKPCSPREILARISAILRRTSPDPSTTASQGPQRISFDGYLLNLAAMELHGPKGEVIPLTTAEFQLLNVFVQRPQRVLSRQQLTDLLHGDGWSGYDRAIDGLVSRLRRKIPGR